MQKFAFLALPGALIVLATFMLVRPGFEDAGCACSPPPSLAEVAKMTTVANDKSNPDSLDATGQVYFAYLERGENKQAEMWKARAIAIGEPKTLMFVADTILEATSEEHDPRKQAALLSDAIDLLKKVEPRRRLLNELDRHLYVDQLRGAEGTLAILKDGIDAWTAKANAGDATAAHHIAAYYFFGHLDQEKRRAWEARAANLGDPGFAWLVACCWRETSSDLVEGKQVIQRARSNRKAWSGVGDTWMQSVLAEELSKAEAQIDDRLSKLHRLRRP